jgi:hypothetical protein
MRSKMRTRLGDRDELIANCLIQIFKERLREGDSTICSEDSAN